MFVRGKEEEGLVLEHTTRTEFSKEYFKKYFENRVIDIPETFRGKKPKEDKKKKEKKEDKDNVDANRKESS